MEEIDMKSLKLGGACLAIAVLAAVTVAVSAQASKQSATPTQEAAVQSAVQQENLVVKLRAALGSGFGGVWYEQPAVQLNVGVTSTTAAGVAEATAARSGLAKDVTEVPVRSSETELAAAQKGWNNRLADLLARQEVATQASIEDNSVLIELGSNVSAGERGALEGEASEASVEVVVSAASRPKLGVALEARCRKFEASKAWCDPTIVGGTTLENKAGPLCTVGPAVVPPKGVTETFVLTAGHCVAKVGESFFSLNKEGTKTEEIGKAVAFLSEAAGNNVDVAVIKVENAFWKQAGEVPVIPAIAEWSALKETEPFIVKGELAPVVGEKTCISGQTTGFHCGTIKATKLTLGKLEELVEVEKTATAGGDSGAPWFSEVGKLVEGTHVGKNEKTTNPVFEPLQFSLKRLKEVSKLELELLTEKNQKRM
jgi:streptogrisin C